MSKTIKEVLQLHWMDGAKLSGGSYHGEPSLNAEEAIAEIERLLKEAKPDIYRPAATHYSTGFNMCIDIYSGEISKILGVSDVQNRH